MLQGRTWRRLARDIYCRADVPVTTDTLAQATRLVLPRGAVVSGRSAALLHGCDVRRSSDEPVEITAPRGVTQRSRGGLLCAHQALVPPQDIVEIDGIPVTSPIRTAFDLARLSPIEEAVVAMDAMLRASLISPEELLDFAASHSGWRGVRQVPRAVSHADARAESPMETRLRMCIVLGGLPRPEVQFEIVDGGHVIARLDLAYEHARLDIEFDGGDHRRLPHVIERDAKRQRELTLRGWTTLVFDATDVYRRQRYIHSCVGSVLDRAA